MNIKAKALLKVALIADELTTSSLSNEPISLYNITPYNYKLVFGFYKPDILFVESAWQGKGNAWKFKVADYPEHPKRSNNALRKVVEYAKKRGVPTVFWNKEDGVHFNRFIDSAKYFDHIFTVDENCIPKYKERVTNDVSVNTLLFAVQPKIHNFSALSSKQERVNFVGSYSTHIHDQRREMQHMMFEATAKSNLGLTIYDRNSKRKSNNYRFPVFGDVLVNPAVKYADTAQIYKNHLASLNVNTIVDSPTMFSRRLIEIIACGGIAITNPSPAVSRYFSEYCYQVKTEGELLEIFERLKSGFTKEDQDRALAGAEYIANNHTWSHRLEQIISTVGL